VVREHATEYAGPAADALTVATQTAVPLLPAHALLHAASVSEAAAELSVLPATLAEQLGKLHPYLQPLVKPEGRIDRALLLAAYPSTLCALHAGARNRPAPCP
jgi:hypothetical protein